MEESIENLCEKPKNKQDLMLEIFNSIINDEKCQRILNAVVKNARPEDTLNQLLGRK